MITRSRMVSAFISVAVLVGILLGNVEGSRNLEFKRWSCSHY